MLQSDLLSKTIKLSGAMHVLFLNSAAHPFVNLAARQVRTGTITLAEDNVATLHATTLRHIPYHEYTLREPPATMDIAILDLLYQPNNAWIQYGLQLAAYALKQTGTLYVTGAKERGILSTKKRMEELFGNVETLAIHKGQRVLAARKGNQTAVIPLMNLLDAPSVFATGKLDEGTRLLLDALEVRKTDDALDLGSGAGYLGLRIARLATKGSVTMVDASLVAVALARRLSEQSGLSNVRVLPGDGAQAVLAQRFDLVVTNPPFHLGGLQTSAIAHRFIREAAHVLRPRGRFYLVANRFLKYEPTLQAHFHAIEEVGGNTRYKVLRAMQPKQP
ncbi:MAG TPA: methyltransferase [Ktedonobacteraceae bacterium]|nr:methyltransferase [Ktedonobacteraceae bacterium]